MILPKKNQLKAATEKTEYLKKLLDLDVITKIEYDSYIFFIRQSIYLDPEKKQFIEPGQKLNKEHFKSEKYMGKGTIQL